MEATINNIDPVLLAALGAVLPLVMAVVNRAEWSSDLKALAAFAVAVGFGLIAAWWQDTWTKDGILTSVLAVY